MEYTDFYFDILLEKLGASKRKAAFDRYKKQGIADALINQILDKYEILVDRKPKQMFDDIKISVKKDQRVNIEAFTNFRELEQLIHYVEGQIRPIDVKSAETEDEVTLRNSHLIKEDDDVAIYYAKDNKACIQIKGSHPTSWCIAQSNLAVNYYNSYRYTEGEPTFYFIRSKKKPDTDRYHFFVLQILLDGGYKVTSALNDGDEEMEWSDIVRIEPALAKYKDLFKHVPLTDKERSDYDRFSGGINLEEYLKLSYQDKMNYISIYHGLSYDQFEKSPRDIKQFYIGHAKLSGDQFSLIKDDPSLYKTWLRQFLMLLNNGVSFQAIYEQEELIKYIKSDAFDVDKVSEKFLQVAVKFLELNPVQYEKLLTKYENIWKTGPIHLAATEADFKTRLLRQLILTDRVNIDQLDLGLLSYFNKDLLKKPEKYNKLLDAYAEKVKNGDINISYNFEVEMLNRLVMYNKIDIDVIPMKVIRYVIASIINNVNHPGQYEKLLTKYENYWKQVTLINAAPSEIKILKDLVNQNRVDITKLDKHVLNDISDTILKLPEQYKKLLDIYEKHWSRNFIHATLAIEGKLLTDLIIQKRIDINRLVYEDIAKNLKLLKDDPQNYAKLLDKYEEYWNNERIWHGLKIETHDPESFENDILTDLLIQNRVDYRRMNFYYLYDALPVIRQQQPQRYEEMLREFQGYFRHQSNISLSESKFDAIVVPDLVYRGMIDINQLDDDSIKIVLNNTSPENREKLKAKVYNKNIKECKQLILNHLRKML